MSWNLNNIPEAFPTTELEDLILSKDKEILSVIDSYIPLDEDNSIVEWAEKGWIEVVIFNSIHLIKVRLNTKMGRVFQPERWDEMMAEITKCIRKRKIKSLYE
jgi:hypothetical protein